MQVSEHIFSFPISFCQTFIPQSKEIRANHAAATHCSEAGRDFKCGMDVGATQTSLSV